MKTIDIIYVGIMFILTFGSLYALVLVAEWKNKRDLKSYHAANVRYLEKIAKENNLKTPVIKKRDLDPNAPEPELNQWTPSKDMDYVMKGGLTDFYD